MNEHTRYFLAGTLAAGLTVSLFTDLDALQAISNRVAYSHLTSELRMGIDIGLLDPAIAREGNLDEPLTRREFGLLLKKTLQMLGSPAGSEVSDLSLYGVFDMKNARGGIARKEVLESLCRAVIHLADYGFVTIKEAKAADFSDYSPPPKYATAFGYLRSENIVRGYGATFGVKRALSRREAVTFLYRLYEKVAAARVRPTGEKRLAFIDIPEDHPVMEQIRGLHEAGAFDAIDLQPSFDGDRIMKLKDLCAMVCGVMAKKDKAADTDRVQKIVSGKNPEAEATREDLAMMLSTLTGAISSENKIAPVVYSDVAGGSPLEEALTSLSGQGITLGYPNKVLRGSEAVSWFEGVGVMAALGKAMNWFEPVQPDEVAGKSDFERLANVIREKKARVRAILERRREK